MAEIFNNHFRKQVKNWKQNIKPTKKKYDNYLNEKIENSFIIKPTNNDEVLSKIKQLENGKATDSNSLNTILMKIWAKEINESLALLFNMLFTDNIFLESLKLANIIPIHKKG